MGLPHTIYHAHDEKLEQIDLGWLAQTGFDAVQISPMNTSKNGGGAWYDMYQPHKYLELDSRIGNEQQLIVFCEKAHENGLQVVADVVFNHCQGVAANGGEMRDWHATGRIGEFYRRLDSDMVPEFSSRDFHSFLPGDTNQYTAYLQDNLPSFNFNSYVREVHKKHLDLLHNAGVDGLRFDVAKGLPVDVFVDYVNHWRWRKGVGDAFAYGEYWDRSIEALNAQGHHFTSLTDFPLQWHLKEVFEHGGSLLDLDIQNRSIGIFDVRFARTHDQTTSNELGTLSLEDLSLMAGLVNSLGDGATLTLNWECDKKITTDSVKFRQIMRQRAMEGKNVSERLLTGFFRTKVSVCVARGEEGFALINKGRDTIDYHAADVTESQLEGIYQVVNPAAQPPLVCEIRRGGDGNKYIKRWNTNYETRGGVKIDGRTALFFERVG